jgi:hypothetical protein
MKFPVGLSFLSNRHRIVVVPQDGDCALHVIVQARKTGSPIECRNVISSRITTDNFRSYVLQYAMTSAPHIQKRILACETAEALRTVIDHASYYMTNDDLVDLGLYYEFYPVIINQKYNDKSAHGPMRDTLLLCNPYHVDETHLKKRFLDGDIPAILFYNRSDISHYESIEYRENTGGWTALITVAKLDATLRRFMDVHCGVATTPVGYLMDENKQYITDLDELTAELGPVQRLEDEFGETIYVRDNIVIHVSPRYPQYRPTVMRNGIDVDISYFWTPGTTLLELAQPVQSLETQYQRYLHDKTLRRPRMLQACRLYGINRTGIGKMRRFMLCRLVAEFETTHGIPSFTVSADEDEDALIQSLLDVSL